MPHKVRAAMMVRLSMGNAFDVANAAVKFGRAVLLLVLGFKSIVCGEH